jgi:hypothetical protein
VNDYLQDPEETLFEEYKTFLERGAKAFAEVFRFIALGEDAGAGIVHCASTYRSFLLSLISFYHFPPFHSSVPHSPFPSFFCSPSSPFRPRHLRNADRNLTVGKDRTGVFAALLLMVSFLFILITVSNA